ncbi:uncharacterized protein F5Z01DRAFT_676348 [Emericellopsis atlantica]|uniref:Uncharacterized protein n=1 Tax=Emericellopsis atlantica TaxID=2614577 RepID=A0A9P7ZHC0_9HYPO|nr:uncharacterized protein F5Z01DRAFT_676348 [Emericellopsis atlantica]KAG9252109.1 hypothetical protein F5Z01DRAFT_676348 [Emericellopsis atlantica]
MSKPSGPRNAVLTMNWNYPTFRSSTNLWGSVLDPSNPCLRAQSKKFGNSELIRTQNRLPIRAHYKEHGVQWADTVGPNWPLIQDVCHDFNQWLNKGSKIIMAIGNDNIDENLMIDMEGLESVEILGKPSLGARVFGQRPSFKIIRCIQTKTIRHLFFISHHSQHFLYPAVGQDVRAFHDLMWNAVAEMAGLQLDADHSAYFMREATRRPSRANKFVGSQFDIAKSLRGIEKRSGQMTSEKVVRDVFEPTLRKNPTWELKADDGSFVRWIIQQFSKRARETLSSDAFKESEAGQRLYRQHIANISGPRDAAKQQASRRQTVGTLEWKASDTAKKMKSDLKKNCKLPQNKHQEKLAAFQKVKQYKDLESKDVASLTAQEATARSKMVAFTASDLDKKKWATYYKSHVVWWSPHQPGGLRYEGDQCPDVDDFDYENEIHPAVKIIGLFSSQQKAAFTIETEP